MKNLNTPQKAAVGMLLLLLCTVGLLGITEKITVAGEASDSSELRLEFSQESGFYSEPFLLEIQGEDGAEIYYTLDGSWPDKESESSCLYEEAIPVYCDDGEEIFHINCVAYSHDGEVSKVYSRTFLTGTGIGDRYEIPVLAVYGDPEDLFGYEAGIFVDGKLGDEYLAANPQLKDSTLPSNWIAVYGNRYLSGREGERQASMTLFDSDGTVMLSQGCGIRLFGNMSRQKNQPSFRLFARKEYDEQNRFECVLFPEQQDACGNTLTGSYKRLTVRNGGSDNGYAFIRSELAGVLSGNAGFLDSQNARAVCVYINGEYYGAYWFITTFDDEYFRDTYGDYPGGMYVFEGDVYEVRSEKEGEEEIYGRLAEEYNEQYDRFAEADLSLDENWEALEDFIDVDNFLQYAAIENYIGNTDSMHNNFRTYRYYSEEGKYEPDSVFDGKYRFLLYDLDLSMGIEQVSRKGAFASIDNLSDLLNGISDVPESGELLAGLFERQEAREQYIRYTLALANYYFAKEQAEPVLDEMFGSIEKELKLMYATPGMMEDNFLTPEETDYAQVEESLMKLKTFLEDRPKYVIESLQGVFGEMTPYTLMLGNESQAVVTIDAVELQDCEYEGIYFQEVPVTLSAVPRPGYRFQCWLVNEEIYTDAELTVDAALIRDGTLLVECICEAEESRELCITALKPKGGNDYIELTNFGEEEKNLRDYYLSDDPESREKSTLPNLVVPAGESVRIYCRNYTGAEALGKPGVNFNIKAGETICLTDRDGSLCSRVEVPKLGLEDGVYTLNLFTGKYEEILP